MCRIGYCPGCKQHGMILSRHHKWKRSVWGRNKKKNGKSIWFCRDCHSYLEAEITRRENALLQQHPEIYIGTLNEFLKEGFVFRSKKESCETIETEPPKPVRSRRKEKQEGGPISFPQSLATLI